MKTAYSKSEGFEPKGDFIELYRFIKKNLPEVDQRTLCQL